MPQWIGSNDFFAGNPGTRRNAPHMNPGENNRTSNDLHNAPENLFHGAEAGRTDTTVMPNWRQARRQPPPQPAGQRHPGFPARIMTRREAEGMKPPRQYAIPGTQRQDRPLWPENVGRNNPEPTKIPVYAGMLDGHPYGENLPLPFTDDPYDAQPPADAPMFPPDPDDTPSQARAPEMSAIDETFEEDEASCEHTEQGSILSVYGIEPSSIEPLCDVGREMREVSSGFSRYGEELRALAQRLSHMEARLTMLERRRNIDAQETHDTENAFMEEGLASPDFSIDETDEYYDD